MQDSPPAPPADSFKSSEISERTTQALKLLEDPSPVEPQGKGLLKSAWESTAAFTRNLMGHFFYGDLPQPVPAEEARHLALKENDALKEEFGTTEDKQLNGRLEKAIQMAQEALPNAGYAGRMAVLDTDEERGQANADGSIIVSRGLMEKLSDEELLFVVGHEMGHLEVKHDSLRLAYEQRLATAKSAGAQAYFAQRMMEFYHDAEREADDFGVRVLEHHGLGKEHAVSFMIRKMSDLQGGDAVSSTHPSDAERAWRLASRP